MLWFHDLSLHLQENINHNVLFSLDEILHVQLVQNLGWKHEATGQIAIVFVEALPGLLIA